MTHDNRTSYTMYVKFRFLITSGRESRGCQWLCSAPPQAQGHPQVVFYSLLRIINRHKERTLSFFVLASLVLVLPFAFGLNLARLIAYGLPSKR